MHVPQYLLISADHEKPDEIIFVAPNLVQGEKSGPAVLTDETGDLTVRITGDIGDGSDYIGLFIKALEGHDGK